MGLIDAAAGFISKAADLNPLSKLSDMAEGVCDALLPDKFEFIGDIVGGGVALLSGNHLKALDQALDLIDTGKTSGKSQTALAAFGASWTTAPDSAPRFANFRADYATLSKEAFTRLSPEQLYAAMRRGQIPEDVINDPKALQFAQSQVQLFSQSMSLLTQMMMAAHQVNKEIIGNFRA